VVVILPFSFFPFGVYLCYIFFSSTIPKDLLAAARVDGCNEWVSFATWRSSSAPGGRARGVLCLRGRLEQLLFALRDVGDNSKLPVQVALST